MEQHATDPNPPLDIALILEDVLLQIQDLQDRDHTDPDDLADLHRYATELEEQWR